MLWVPKHAGKLSYSQTELIHVIRRCGLTSGLKLCLDAGDAASYASGQSWLDTSGNGYDFFLGADGSVAADDPTFNGTAGQRAPSNYWSFDGGDFFRYDSANETWMQNLHKDNAKFTIVAGVQNGALGDIRSICGTTGGVNAVGVQFYISDSGEPRLRVRGDSGVSVLFLSTVMTSAEDVPHFMAVSLDEAAGANGASTYLNGVAEYFTSTYTGPSVNSAGYTLEIGSTGSGGTPQLLPATSRLWFIAIWESIVLTKTQVDAVYMGMRGRMGI